MSTLEIKLHFSNCSHDANTPLLTAVDWSNNAIWKMELSLLGIDTTDFVMMDGGTKVFMPVGFHLENINPG